MVDEKFLTEEEKAFIIDKLELFMLYCHKSDIHHCELFNDCPESHFYPKNLPDVKIAKAIMDKVVNLL